MTHAPAPNSPAAAAPQETPARKAAFTRRVRRAAREVETAAGGGPDESAGAALPVVADGDPHLPPLDAHGFDPADYQWIPVRRKPRKDGWTPQRQQDFIAALADTGCVEQAALAVGMNVRSCYRLRRAPGSESFNAAWDIALQHASRRLLDVVFDRAFRGTTEPVFDRDGNQCGVRARQSDRLAMFLLRAYMPERFRHANRDWRGADEALPGSALAAPPIEGALAALAPVTPEEPHALMAPDDLDDALNVADQLPPGELPRWHRPAAEPAPEAVLPSEVETELARLRRGEGHGPVRPRGWVGAHPGRDLG